MSININRRTVCEELDGVKKWAESNNLKQLNTDKSREMMVLKSGRWTVPEPPPLGMQRAFELKILGVLFTNDLSVTSHVDDIISKCASSTNRELRVLKANGLQDMHCLRYTQPDRDQPSPICRPGMVR